MNDTTKIYVWCNYCSDQGHCFMALAEDGDFLAGHVCSSHAWAYHDMGINEDGWKRDLYAAKYPDGFEVVLVQDARPGQCPGLDAAYELNQAKAAQRAAEQAKD